MPAIVSHTSVSFCVIRFRRFVYPSDLLMLLVLSLKRCLVPQFCMCYCSEHMLSRAVFFEGSVVYFLLRVFRRGLSKTRGLVAKSCAGSVSFCGQNLPCSREVCAFLKIGASHETGSPFVSSSLSLGDFRAPFGGPSLAKTRQFSEVICCGSGGGSRWVRATPTLSSF